MHAGARSGIVGAGFIGQVHARAVRNAGGLLAAVFDASPEAPESVAARIGAARGAGTAEELIHSPDVDVVHVCTPNHTHAAIVRLALAAGKHVICEKPLATTLEDAEELVGLAEAAGVVCAVPFAYRYYPTIREARARLASGDLGQIHLIHGSYLQDWLAGARDQNWRVDPALGGASRTFADIGVHWCDLIEFTTGHRITSLVAKLKTAIPERIVDGTAQAVTTEDAAMIMFETDRGAVGTLVTSQITQGRKNRLWFSIDAAEASLSFDQELPETVWMGRRDGVELLQRGASLLSADAGRLSVVPAGHPQGFQDCFNGLVADVYSAINGEPAPGLPTFADGHRAAVLTVAVLASAKSGTWVEVPEERA
jgi:predicted dehydrogenase